MDSGCLTPATVLSFLFGGDLSLECSIQLMSVESVPTLGFLAYLSLFAWTLALEAPWFLLLRMNCMKRVSLRRCIAILTLANLLTHPIVTFILPRMGHHFEWPMIVGLLVEESFAPIVETFVLRQLSPLKLWQAAALSFSANLFSWWIGGLLPTHWFLA